MNEAREAEWNGRGRKCNKGRVRKDIVEKEAASITTKQQSTYEQIKGGGKEEDE